MTNTIMSNQFEDMALTCKDCKIQFIFTAGEQAFFAERGYSPRKRCPACNQRKKEQNNNAAPSQGNAQPQFQGNAPSQFRGSSKVAADIEVVHRPLKGGKGPKNRRNRDDFNDDYDDDGKY